MNSKTPIVSVVMAAYNAERFIGEAIQGILNQTFKDFELVIVNDSSIDNTWKVVEKFASIDKRIKLFQNSKNLGGCKTLNKAMKLAKGKYIAVMDNDDWSYPQRLEKQVDILDKNPEVGIVGGAMEIMNETGVVTASRYYHLTDTDIRKNIFKFSPFAHPLIMMRRSVLESVGFGDCSYAPADDYELYFRIGTVSKFANIDELILKYRVVPGSITQRTTKKMILATIKSRYKYRNTVGYRMGFRDSVSSIILCLLAYILPAKIFKEIFNFVRNDKKL